MPLSPSATWLKGAMRSASEPVVIVEITDDSTTWYVQSGQSNYVNYANAVVSIANIAEELDPLTRQSQVGGVDVFLVDAWLRPIIYVNRLRGKKLVIKLGWRDTPEADFLPLFTGIIADHIPEPGANVIRVSAVDTFDMLKTSKIVGEWGNQHPLEIAEDILGKAGVPSALIDSTSFDPSNYASTISHLNIGRGGIRNMYDTTVRDPTTAFDLLMELAEILNGLFVCNELGQIKFVEFDSSASADDHFDTSVLREFRQDEYIQNTINEVIITYARDAEGQSFPLVDFTLSSDEAAIHFKYPTESSRIITEKIDTLWLNKASIMHRPYSAIDPSDTSFKLTLPPLGGTGQRDPATSWSTISSDRPAYFVLIYASRDGAYGAHEIVKCTTAPTFEGYQHTVLVRADGTSIRAISKRSAGTFTVTRAQMGTSAISVIRGGILYDITIPYMMAHNRIKRFQDGAPIVEFKTPLTKAWLQYGDQITLEIDDYIDYNQDGLDASAGNWEITQKEVHLFDSPPHIQWRCVYAHENASYTPSVSVVKPGFANPGSITDEIQETKDVTRVFVNDGHEVSAGTGLTAIVAEGAAASGFSRSTLYDDATVTLDASSTNYITKNVNSGELRQYTSASGWPDILPDEMKIAKVTTDASSVTDIDTSDQDTTALAGEKLDDGAVGIVKQNTNQQLAASLAANPSLSMYSKG